MKKILTTIGALAVISALTIAVPVSAQNAEVKIKVGANGRASTSASSTTTFTASTTLKKALKLDQASARLQTQAENEINRRIAGLNRMLVKIEEMKRASSSTKAALKTTIQAQINLLNNLSIKLKAGEDASTVKTDIDSLGKVHANYRLVMPQVAIIAAADRLASTTQLLTDLSAKLQTRINDSIGAGSDASALLTLLADMKAKIASAKVHANAAISAVINLKPDNGSATVRASNEAALKTAREHIKEGTQDIKNAHKDAMKIRIGLKLVAKINATSTATSTSSTTTQ